MYVNVEEAVPYPPYPTLPYHRQTNKHTGSSHKQNHYKSRAGQGVRCCCRAVATHACTPPSPIRHHPPRPMHTHPPYPPTVASLPRAAGGTERNRESEGEGREGGEGIGGRRRGWVGPGARREGRVSSPAAVAAGAGPAPSKPPPSPLPQPFASFPPPPPLPNPARSLWRAEEGRERRRRGSRAS